MSILRYLPMKVAKAISRITGISIMPYYKNAIELDTPRHEAIQEFDSKARENGSMDEICDKYLNTVPGAETVVPLDYNPFSWTLDLIESHGGAYAVYEECLKRNITWEELVDAEEYGRKIMKEVNRLGINL